MQGVKQLKLQQPSMSIDEHIENLKHKGLIFGDEEYAKAFLNDVSYYRLVKAYSVGLKAKNGNYDKGIRFEDIVGRYLFNAKLRQAVLAQIERVEINLRCRLGNYFSDKYGVLGYEDINNFDVSPNLFQTFSDDMLKEVTRNKKSPFVINFQQNYIDGKIPLYALMELFSFGTLSKFYKNMKNKDKKAVSAMYGIGFSYFDSWIESIAYVRNICAHYGRIYNIKFAKTPRLYKRYKGSGISNLRLFATLITLHHLLPNDRHWHEFVETIELLFEKYSNVKLDNIDFPQDWTDYLKN